MNNITKTKIEELENRHKEIMQILERANALHIALLDYTKNNINKTFFEKYFLMGSKDWKGIEKTAFSFSSPAYSFCNYAKRIYLACGEYIEITDTKRETVLKATEEKISNITAWLESNENTRKNILSASEEDIKKDLLAVYKKHNNPELWKEILQDYDIKYPKIV